MKTKPITIEPGSGAKLAGKRITYIGLDDSLLVIYVSDRSILLQDDAGNHFAFPLYRDWLEVLPDDLPQDSPKEPPAHEEFFNEWGYFATCFKDEDGLTPTFNQVYQAFESKILAKLKSDNLI